MATFLAEGFAELGRKLDRFKLARRMVEQDAQRAAALAALGQRAWEERVDLAGHSEARARLEALDARAGEIAQTSGKLRADEEALMAERRAEAERFEARRRDIETRRTPVDGALRASSARKAAAEQAIRQGATRIAALDAQLAALDRESVALPEGDPKRAGIPGRRTALVAEQDTARSAMETARTELPALAAENEQLAAQSRQFQQELAAVIVEERAALAKLDAALGKIRSELGAASQHSSAVQRDRAAAYQELGEQLYRARADAPPLAEGMARVSGIDEARAATQASREGSLAQTRALPRATMAKFWAVVAGIPLLVVVGIAGFNAWQRRPPAPAPVARIADPEAERTQAVQRHLKAPNDPALREAALRILRDDAINLGATTDPAHLPTLARLLKSDDPGLRAAAARAMAMIGPTPAQTADLLELLKDPQAEVSNAARQALSESFDPAARAAVDPDRR